MSEITGKYPVMYMDVQAGDLEVSVKGLMTVFTCICSLVSSDVLRLYCVCNGKTVPIGVMLPCSKNLTLSKTFSKNALSQLGITDIEYVFISKDGSRNSSSGSQNQTNQTKNANTATQNHGGSTHNQSSASNNPEKPRQATGNLGPSRWTPEPEPWRLFSQEDISRSCRSIKGAYVRFQGDTSYLAVPISPSEPFPPMPIFCFGSLEKINGGDYIVFTMKDGKFI